MLSKPSNDCVTILLILFVAMLAQRTIATIHVPEGFELVEGDMLVRKAMLQSGKLRPLLFQPQYLWPNLGQNIQYDLSQGGLSESWKTQIRAGFAQYTSRTCLTFTEVVGASNSTPHIRFVPPGSGCWSYVGYFSNYMTQLNMDPNGCFLPGIITHEIGHSLGLFHEMQRPDRENYLLVDESVVDPAQVSNFQVKTSNFVSVNPYDYNSMMQYESYSFVKSAGQTSIWAPQAIGQRVGLSAADAAEINFMYANCDSTSVVCLHTVSPGTTLVVGSNYTMTFSVNTGDGGGSTVTFTLPPDTTSSVASGSTVSALSTIKFTVIGTGAKLAQAITVSVTFTKGSKTATCSASVYVKPYADPKNCHGILATSSTVCSGHGNCVYTDVCNCTSGYVGFECETQSSLYSDYAAARGWITMYDGLSTTFNTPAWVSAMDYWEDYTLDYTDGTVTYFELDRISIPVQVSTSADVTFTIYDSSGSTSYGYYTTTLSAGSLSSTSTWWEIVPGRYIGQIPRQGRLRVKTSANAFWLSGTGAMTTGTDDTSRGSAGTGKRLYFRLQGTLLCNDGFYGSKCQNGCPNRDTSTIGAAQCFWHGICHDGTNGDGSCTCLGSESSASCETVSTKCSEFSSANCPFGQVSSGTTTDCTDSVCTVAMCCVAAVKCSTFDSSTCPTGKVLVANVNKYCAATTCTASECCEAVDPCLSYSNCSICTAQSACGWCATKGMCLSGSANGPPILSCSQWQYDSDMCTAACTSGVIVIAGRTGANAAINAKYRKVFKVNRNYGRPYYLQSNGWYLFYASNGLWMIGNDIASTSGYAYNTDSANEPQLLAAAWNVYDAGWKSDSAVTTTCAAPACGTFNSALCAAGQVVTPSFVATCGGSSCTAAECCVTAPSTCADFESELCPSDQVSSRTTTLCADNICTTAICCETAMYCGQFSSSSCPSGQELTTNVRKRCFTGTCTAAECCATADTCKSFTDCATCANQSACGWCASKGLCLSGTADGPPALLCARWQYDFDMCTASCTTGVMVLSGRVGANSIINANYRKVFKATRSNGKPYYQQSSSPKYMFFSPGKAWWVGDTININGGYAYNSEPVPEPSWISTAWNIWNGSSWVLDSAVKMSCTAAACSSFNASRCAVGQIVTPSLVKRCSGASCTTAECCVAAPGTCADFESELCPSGQVSSRTTTLCADLTCTAAACCEPAMYCGQYTQSCPSGQELVEDLGKRCFTGTCFATDCCRTTDPCNSYTSCSTCTAQSSCGWCASKSVCFSGTADGPTFSVCSQWQYDSDMCTAACTSGVVEIAGRVGDNAIINGKYRKVFKVSRNNGKPYYLHSSSGNYLFLAPSGYWMIGAVITSSSGYAYNTNAASEPQLVSVAWNVYSSGWVSDSAVTTTCAVPACKNFNASACPSHTMVDPSYTKICAGSSCTIFECCVTAPTCALFTSCTGKLVPVASPLTVYCKSEVCKTSDCCVTTTPTATATLTLTRRHTTTPTRTALATFSATPSRTSTSSSTLTSSASPSPSPTPSPSPSSTRSVSATLTLLATFSATNTRTGTDSSTPTPTASPTPSPTSSNTQSPTSTHSETQTISPAVTHTRTPTASPSPTTSATPTRSDTISPTTTPHVTFSATASSSESPSSSSTRTRSVTRTYPLIIVTFSPTPTPTKVRTLTATRSLSATITASGTRTHSSTRTSSFSSTETVTASSTVTIRGTITPSATNTLTATLSGSASTSTSASPTGVKTATETLSATNTVSTTNSASWSFSGTASLTHTSTASASATVTFTSKTRNCNATWINGTCSKTCGLGSLTQTYRILVNPIFGGRNCTNTNGTTRSVSCTLRIC